MQNPDTMISALKGAFAFIQDAYKSGFRAIHYDVYFSDYDCPFRTERESGAVAKIVETASAVYGNGWWYWREQFPKHSKEYLSFGFDETLAILDSMEPSLVVKVFSIPKNRLRNLGAVGLLVFRGCTLEVYEGITDKLVQIVTPLGKFTL